MLKMSTLRAMSTQVMRKFLIKNNVLVTIRNRCWTHLAEQGAV